MKVDQCVSPWWQGAWGLMMMIVVGGYSSEPKAENAMATFAGGCFWCMEKPFDDLEGVISTTSGYVGGRVANPTYRQVSAGTTGHTEAVQVVFDRTQVSYEQLLAIFWRNIDPLDRRGQFCDKGSQYRSGVFYHSPDQQRAAEKSVRELAASGRFKQSVVTEVTAASTFYPAEEYHQNYYLKNPIRYNFYRRGCGRDKRLLQLWGEAAH